MNEITPRRTDMIDAYLIHCYARRGKKSRAHLWTGTDTVCRMWSTGGLAKSKYDTYDDSRGLKICTMCQATGQKHEAEAEA